MFMYMYMYVCLVVHTDDKFQQAEQSALSTSWTVEGPSPNLIVDKTFEQSSLLTWNTV